MCGIAGYISKIDALVDAVVIEKMTAAIQHRGPDDQGLLVEANVALGHRRLAIIDLSPGGHQPMRYAMDARYSIVFNGEIYNYLELKDHLAGKGYSFTTDSDTEVIMAAYLQWGKECVRRFNGMWAFALLDRKNNTLFCSRDRFGIKPFYFVDDDCKFAFGSEIRQLLPLLDQVQANMPLLQDFILTSRADHTDETFFKYVRKLPAGHNLVYDLGGHVLTIERYFQLKPVAGIATLNEEDAIALYSERFSQGVALRLRADVPVATCLSGGLDSSSVACIAASMYARQSGNMFSAITAVSEQAETDESSYAELVVKHAKLRWLTVRPTYQDFLDSLFQVVEAQEEPFTSPSLTMQYFVMKTAKDNGICVLLDGQGGDETLLGYEKYYAAYFVGAWRRKGVVAAFKMLRQARRNNTNMTLLRIAKYLLAGLSAKLRFRVHCWQHSYLKDKGCMPKHLEDFSKASLDEFNIQALEITKTNLPLLLRYEDKNSMHHSVEARLPFLDFHTLEAALSLSGDYKIKDGWSKWILRRCMEGSLPTSIVWRKNKLNFDAPESLWLSSHYQIMRETVLASALLEKICDMGLLAKKYGKLDKRSQWRLYSIALWERAFDVNVEPTSTLSPGQCAF
ncbi:asparagine synthase (glutamine-hydrolyzing) [Allopusillimonas ginsengisoli]|nr:asparagine synthase (glutamine-hydrolyzing) [Allopusillimonas ginsengisoli]